MDDLPVPIKPRSSALLKRARSYASKSRAANTLGTYQSLWKDFIDFCEMEHATPLPADPSTVAQYITLLASGQKVSTIETKLAAISFRHRTAGHPDPTKSETVKLVLGGIQREHGAPPDRKAAVELDLLERMIRGQTETLRGVRNRSILLVGYACDLRRGELVALQVGDVRFLSDRMVITIRRSKTDQARQGYEIHVPRIEAAELCPVRTLKTWLEVSGIKTGPLFRKVDRWERVGEAALTDQVIADVVKEAVLSAGLDPKDFAGHSLRRGLITQAARNREQTGDIRKVSRHKTEVMVDAYRADTAETQMRVIRGALSRE